MERVEHHGGIQVFNWGRSKCEVKGPIAAVVCPIEFHFKDDGAKDGGPSMAIVFEDVFGHRFIGEITLKMFEPVMRRINAYSFT